MTQPISDGDQRSLTEQEEEQEFLYQLILYTSHSLRSRAEAMVQHAETHKAVSKMIIENVMVYCPHMGR
jgi:hypothetical protein